VAPVFNPDEVQATLRALLIDYLIRFRMYFRDISSDAV
jgi:hypothetical protein